MLQMYVYVWLIFCMQAGIVIQHLLLPTHGITLDLRIPLTAPECRPENALYVEGLGLWSCRVGSRANRDRQVIGG